MGTFVNSGKNAMLDSLSSVYISLHSGDPGANGANELSGGAYARKAASFAAANSGSRALSADVTLDVPAATTVAYVGFWSALTGGTFLGAHDATDETFASAGKYVVTASGTSLAIT